LVLIISALKVEVSAILKRMKKIKILNRRMPLVYEGHIKNKKIILIISGIGKNNASFASAFISSNFLENNSEKNNKGLILKKIIICGVSGALKEGLSIGDVMVCDRILLRDSKSFRIASTIRLKDSEKALKKTSAIDNDFLKKEFREKFKKNKLFFSGSLLTVYNVLSDRQEKKLINKRFNADIADMESFWLLKNLANSKSKADLSCIRAISDNSKFSLPESSRNLVGNENINYYRAFLFILKNPMNFIRLISTGINFRKACRSLNFFIENIL